MFNYAGNSFDKARRCLIVLGKLIDNLLSQKLKAEMFCKYENDIKYANIKREYWAINIENMVVDIVDSQFFVHPQYFSNVDNYIFHNPVCKVSIEKEGFNQLIETITDDTVSSKPKEKHYIRPWLEFIKYLKTSEQTKEMWKPPYTLESMASAIAHYYEGEYFNFYNKYRDKFINKNLQAKESIRGTKEVTNQMSICIARFLKPLNDDCYTNKTPWELFIEDVINELDNVNYDYSQSLSNIQRKFITKSSSIMQ